MDVFLTVWAVIAAGLLFVSILMVAAFESVPEGTTPRSFILFLLSIIFWPITLGAYVTFALLRNSWNPFGWDL